MPVKRQSRTSLRTDTSVLYPSWFIEISLIADIDAGIAKVIPRKSNLHFGGQ